MGTFKRDFEALLEKVDITNNGTIRFPMKHIGKMKGSVKALDLSERARNALMRNGIVTLDILTEKFENLGGGKGVGKKTIKEIKNAYMDYYYSVILDCPADRREFWAEVIMETELLAEDEPKARKGA